MGFTLWGMAIGIIILVPNIFYLIFPPFDVPDKLPKPPLVFTIFEKIGQIGVIVFLTFGKYYYEKPFDVMFYIMIGLIVIYYVLWFRYLFKGRKFKYLYDKVIIPIPMAIIPVLAFFAAAIYGRNPFVLLMSIFLAIGHIKVNYHIYKEIK